MEKPFIQDNPPNTSSPSDNLTSLDLQSNKVEGESNVWRKKEVCTCC